MTATHVQVCPYVVGWMMFKVEPAANTNIVFQESDPVHQRGPGPSKQTLSPSYAEIYTRPADLHRDADQRVPR